METIPAPLLKTEGRRRRRRPVLDCDSLSLKIPSWSLQWVAGFAISHRVAGAGGALYLTANSNSNQFYAIPTYFANGETGARDWAQKLKTPNPRTCSKVSDSVDSIGTKFFLRGGGDFKTF